MPSPVGHALAGIAAGWMVAPADATRKVLLRRVALYGLVAASPDLDLLAGAHSGPTHGLGAAALVGATGWLFLRSRRVPNAMRIGVAIAAAYASHTLLDWLGTDTSPPVGIMALWPFSRGYYESSVHVFMAISRRYWLSEFWVYNARALVREMVILLPIVLAVVGRRSRRRARRD
jgi:membrane-bound metal-dependent hydrolase YbcI (DUF457 family)